MSAMKDKFDSLLHRIEAAAHSLLGHEDAQVHAVAEDVVGAVKELRGDAPELGVEALADAEHVAATAETQGVGPAVAEAESAVKKLGTEAVADVKTAVHDATSDTGATG